MAENSGNDLTLYLRPDNPCNTTVADSEDYIVYEVKTEYEPKTVTTFRNADDAVIATSEWKDVRSDIITLGSAPPVPASTWMRKSYMPFKDTVYLEIAGKKYKWKGNGPGLSLELYEQSDKRNPIARFVKRHRIITDKTTSPPTVEWVPAKLLLDARAIPIQDLVVISFCILEKARRARESSTMNRADAEATPTFSRRYALSHGGV